MRIGNTGQSIQRHALVIALEEIIEDDMIATKSGNYHRIYRESEKWRRREAKLLHKHKMKVDTEIEADAKKIGGEIQ